MRMSILGLCCLFATFCSAQSPNEWKQIADSLLWQQLPVPPAIENANWSISTCEHTLFLLKTRRQNTYSVFLRETTTGTTYMVESRYFPDKGIITDSLRLVANGK